MPDHCSYDAGIWSCTIIKVGTTINLRVFLLLLEINRSILRSRIVFFNLHEKNAYDFYSTCRKAGHY